MKDAMSWLQNWFLSQCDGYWEHAYQIKIETIDNPGWAVFINLEGTDMELTTFKEIQIDKTEANWFQCSVKDNTFRGFGGTKNLIDIIKFFCDWVNDGQKK